ncbi:V-type ATP synthase subunit D [Actinacidiphila glaucinigra]|uniref:V-type ATP synthase subunit D n=1 Tax=Actinacidiphila glaucinigra TaxID=235986 RepID=UPI0036E261D5
MNGGHCAPGRAARLRLRRSLHVASHGADLLDRKLHLLHREHDALSRTQRHCAAGWRACVTDAETWLLRAVVIGGEHALIAAAAGAGGPAVVTVEWTTSLGVRRPASVAVQVPPRTPDTAAPGNTALVRAEAAYREVVRSAASYAAAQSAVRIVEAEMSRTQRRVRVLRRHWIPRLQRELDRVERVLEQAEHEDAVRLRRAHACHGHGGGGPAGRG